MTGEYEKTRYRREVRTKKEPEEKWKHDRAEPYVRKPLHKTEVLKELELEDTDNE